MTKRIKARRIRKIPLLVLVVVLLIAAALGIYFWKFHDTKVTSNIGPTQTGGSINYGPPSADEKNTSQQQKEELLKEDEAETPTNPALSITLSRTGQTASGQPLQVRSVVSGTTKGTCLLKLSRDGQSTIEKTIDVTPDATYVTCNTNVPINEFGAGGEWSLSIEVNADGQHSPPAKQKVMISK